MTTKAARHGAAIVAGLPLFGALAALAAVGCGADAASDPTTATDTQAEELRHGHHMGPKLCRTADDSECDDDDLCLPLLSRACPGPKHVGICVPKPRACPDVTDPVCGCDGKTYDNLCEAAAARTAIDHEGACATPNGCGNGMACPGAGTCVGAPGNSGGDNHHTCMFGHHHPNSTPSGTCQCTVVQQCPKGQSFDSDPAVCACTDGQQADPCARVTCPTGTACVVQSDGSVACQ